ncbi:MAG: hypothetical protein ACE5GB_11655, partial [Acidimicrobiales bacterium]
ALTVTMVLGAAYWTHSGRVTNPVLAREHLTRFPLRRIHLTSGLVLIAGLGANNYLPLYVQAGRGRSAEFAAFSVVSFTFGWAAAAVVFSRSLSQRRECDVILWAASAIVPALALAGAGVHWGWPVGVLFAIYLVPGVCVGLVSVSGLTLLQSSSDASEMGRSNAAHQFIRTLAMTFGVAVGGAVLLSVVKHRVGDVEAVREVLAGGDTIVGADTAAAVGGGLVWVHVVSVLAAIGCLWAALALRRHTERRELSGRSRRS